MADQPSLPMELILSIVDDRADAATIVCCAATCKLLRRHITSAAFLSRLGPDRCTVGLFYRYRDDVPPGAPSYIPTPPSMPLPAFPRTLAGLLRDYSPVASRGGLLVLRRYRQHDELCVCNPVTGRRHFLPPPTINDQTPVLLTDADGTSRSFRLVAADLRKLTEGQFKTQTFSSTAGVWGPITDHLIPFYPIEINVVSQSPMVLNNVLHWLCLQHSSCTVLKFNVDTAEVTSIQILTVGLLRRCVTAQGLLIGSLPDGRLSLLVVEHLVMSVWILAPDGKRWVQHRVIEWERIMRSAGSEVPLYRHHKIQLEWIGEKSGVVFLQMAGVGLLFLNLTTQEVYKVKGSKEIMEFRFCPCELDLVAQLSTMKTF